MPLPALSPRPQALRRTMVLAPLIGWALGPAHAARTLRVGVPNDVADDFVRFIQNRDVASLQRFDGAHSRRDVMELAWLLREIRRQPQAPDVQWVRIDSYERLLAEVRDGNIDVVGTSAWRADLETLGSGNVSISAAMIPKGAFVVGVYTSPRNEAALRVRTPGQLRSLRFVCNSGWTLDWTTLQKLGITPAFDVRTWSQMVALVDAGRADAVLAPFQPTGNAMELTFEGKTLVPVNGLAVALDGSRHLVSSKRTALGKWIATQVFPAVGVQAQSGALRRAYEEAGFYSTHTRTWTVY